MATKELEVKECNVLFYVDHLKRLAVDFDGFGISFDGVEKPKTKTVIIEYKGTIGKRDFQPHIVQ